MLKNLDFKSKIFFLILAVVNVSFGVLIAIVSSRGIQLAKNDAFILAEEMADKNKNEIQTELQGARESAETLAVVFENLAKHNITDRTLINNIIKNNLIKKENISTFCVAYESDAFDLNDDVYGRFALQWSKFGDSIEVEPLGDIENSDWYNVPKMTMQEFVPDPHCSVVHDRKVQMVSFVFPIINEGKFIGVISSDIVLDKLQELSSKVNTRGNGEYTAIFTNTGIVVAHPSQEHLGKDITEIMTDDITEVRGAIKNGRMFISSSNRYYTVYMPIRISPAIDPWSVAVSFPLVDVNKNADSILKYVVIVSIVSFFLIAVILYLIAQSISKPVLTLANTVRSIGEGNFHAEIPIRHGNDEISVLTNAFREMTENLVKAKEQAECSSRAKGDFLSNMSHEMRTPLNAIIGMTSIGKTALDPGKKDYAFEKIGDASVHLLGVINDVLDMSKIEANKMELSLEEFDFEKMISRVLNVINFKVDEKQIKLKVSIDEKIPQWLLGDDLRLTQVITNLLSNAVKFTPEGGTVELNVDLLGEQDGGYSIRFRVADSGIGISREQQKRIFTSFEQAESGTSRKYGGTGLGLAISKRIVELMNGEIHIESELGKGAAFIFTIRLKIGDKKRNAFLSAGGKNGITLPSAGNNNFYATHSANSIRGTSSENDSSGDLETFPGCRILVAEDVEINREIVLALFEPMQMEIDCAENGAEALRLFSKNPKNYNIIFMDVQMPEMDGLEATRQIRALEQRTASQETPIIAMTANVFREDVEKCREAGMDDHIGKPLEMDTVMEKLRKYLPEKGKRKGSRLPLPT